MFGRRASFTLYARSHSMSCWSRWIIVPRVAHSVKPMSASWRAMWSTRSLSRSFTELKTLPSVGRGLNALIWDLAKAMSGSGSMPITSPVDFISGPSTTSMPGKRPQGKTASFTQWYSGVISRVKPSSSSVLPAMTCAASLARGLPMALETNGTVREARGFTSMT